MTPPVSLCLRQFVMTDETTYVRTPKSVIECVPNETPGEPGKDVRTWPNTSKTALGQMRQADGQAES